MPERGTTLKEPLTSSPQSEKTDDIYSYTSITGILLKMAEKFSSGTQNSEEIIKEQFAEYFDYSFNFEPYNVDISYFEIENWGEVNYLSVSIPGGVKQELESKMKAYKDNASGVIEKDDLEHKLASQRFYLEQSIVMALLAISYQKEPENETIQNVWTLASQGRYSLK